jgi:hypothetical protein
MTTTTPSRWTPASVLEGLALALGAWYLVTYFVLAFVRLRYPFELEWMEGAVVDQVRHVAEGHRLYVAPSIHFIPFQYPPLFFYLGALVTKVTGGGFLPLRLISILASIGSFVTLFAMVRRESGSAKAGFLAVALFAACFRADGAWYDLARIDSLCLFFGLAAAYVARFHTGPRAALATAMLLVLAFLTKQSALIVALPLLVYLVAVSRRNGGLALLTFCALAGGATWILDWIHHGWYVYYVFMMPARMQQLDAVSVDFWRQDVLGPLAIASALSLAFVAAGVRRDRWAARAWFYPLLALGMIGSAWLSRLHAGAYDNNLIPAHALISLLFGLALSEPDIRGVGPALCAVQLLMLFYDPRQQLPAPGGRAAGRELLSLIAATPGEVLVPQHGYLSALAGKRSFAHSMAVHDVMLAGRAADAARLSEQFHQALATREFGAVIVDKLDPWFGDDLERDYRRREAAVKDPASFWPVTGRRTRPEWVYVPR